MDDTTVSTLLTIAAVWTAAVVSPGPNFVVTTQMAAGRSRSAGLTVALGVALGSGVWAAVSLMGLGALLAKIGWLYGLLKWLGAAYLLYLGGRLIVTAGMSAAPIAARPMAGGTKSGLRLGLLTNLSNPKTAAFFLSLFVLVIPPDAPFWVHLAIVALVMAISLSWYGLVAACFSLAPVRSAYARARAWVDRVVGAVLILLGLRLATSR